MAKVFTFLISEQIIGSDVSIDGTPQEGFAKDVDGSRIPVLKWRSILSNTSKTTQNGNIFTQEELSEGYADPFVSARLVRKAWYSEFEHPSRIDPERYCMVADSCASHRINSVTFETIDGDVVAIGELETATFSRGPDLRRKMVQGAVPAVSLRAAGNVTIGDNGKERKKLRIFGYDQVFAPSDTYAWGDMKTLTKDFYSESIYTPHAKQIPMSAIIAANGKASKIYRSNIIDISQIAGDIRDVRDSMLIAEAELGVKPKKIIYDTNNLVLGFISEGIDVFTAAPREDMKKIVRGFLSL